MNADSSKENSTNSTTVEKDKFKVLQSNCSASEVEQMLNSGYVVETIIDFENQEKAFMVFVKPDFVGCLDRKAHCIKCASAQQN